MIEDLAIDCGTIRVRTPAAVAPATPAMPPLFVAIGAVSILGLLAVVTKGSSIPITTGKLGGKVVGIKPKK